MDEKTRVYSLNELLLRRKELAQAVQVRKKLFEQRMLYQENLRRTPARAEGDNPIDQVDGHIPRLSKEQVEEEINFYAHKLREVDEVIQQQNFGIDVVGPASIFTDFSSDFGKLEKKAEGTLTKKLAAFLTRRKSLNDICRAGLAPLVEDLVVHVNDRIPASEGVEKLRAKIEKLTAGEAVAKHQFYHKQLRLVDSYIHAANHTTEVEASVSLMDDYE